MVHKMGRLIAALGLLGTLAATPLTGHWQGQTRADAGPTITYWHLWADKYYGGIQDDLAKTFNKTNPGFAVKSLRGQGDLGKFLASVAAGTQPDAYMIPTGPIALAVQGGLMPLDSYLKTSSVIKQADFWPGTWATCTYKGHVYCIPYDYDTFGLFWNKDAFKAAGLPENKPPRTWAELETYAQKLTIKDKKGAITQLGFAPWNIQGSFQEWPMWAMGGQLWDFKTGKPTANTPANVQALQWEVDWAKKFGGFDQINRFTSATQNNSYYEGQKVAMWMAESWWLSTMQQQEPKLRYGVASFGIPTPTGKEALVNGAMDGNMLGIPAGSKHPDLAWKFIEWNATAGIRSWVTQEGDLSARKADINVSPTFLKEPYRSDYRIFTNLYTTKNLFFNQGTPVDSYYFAQRDKQFDLARRGAKSAQQALSDLQTNVERELAKAVRHFHP